MRIRNVFTREALTVPNFLSLFRILLIPFVVLFYFQEKYTVSIVLIAVSAFTDVIDGRIARHWNMVSDLGKMLDPLADKLTEGAIIICLISRYRLMIALLLLMVVKETAMVICGMRALQRNSINGARWFGKLCTVVLYTVMLALLVFPSMSPNLANGLIALAMVVVTFTLVMYLRFYRGVLKR